MNEYWQQQHGLTPDEKRAFVDNAKADEAGFLRSLRKITDRADSRMRERTAKGQRADALDELADSFTPAAPVPDVDDEALQRAGVLA